MPENVSKWDLAMLRVKYEQLGISFDAVFAQIKDIAIKALISIETHVCNKMAKTNTTRGQCFDLFGFDILVDSSLKPWLLEVNMCPSLSCSAKLDKQIKTALLCDVFHTVGIQPFPHSSAPGQQGKLGGTREKSSGNFNPFLHEIGEGTVLSDKDAEMLISLDEELRRSGENFERIFPLKENCMRYERFFECERYGNFLVWKYLRAGRDILAQYRHSAYQ